MKSSTTQERKYRDPELTTNPTNQTWYRDRMSVIPNSHWRKNNYKRKIKNK